MGSSEVSGDTEIAINLNRAQIAHVVHEATGRRGATALLAGNDFQALDALVRPLLGDAMLSRATYRALLVLYAFPADHSGREVTDVAKKLRLSPSTTHRYARTWAAIGLLEQDPQSRRYRRPLSKTDADGSRE